MPTLAKLNQTHPSVDADESKNLRALYEGGKCLKELLPTLLPQRLYEANERYALRKSEAHYRNYLGSIIDYFAALLFTSKPSTTAKDAAGNDATEPDEFYSKFREDCDRQGGDVDAFFKARLTDAMVHRRTWFAVEQPSSDREATDRADFEARGLGDCWLRALCHDDVLDWETDESGNLAWVIVHSVSAKRATIDAGRDQVTETWEHYQRDRIDVYAITYDARNPPTEHTQVSLLDSRRHKLGRVPVLCLELPVGLWAANRLATPQLAHFRLSNAQTWGLSTSCYAMPVFKLKADAEGNFRMPKMGWGYGVVIGSDDDFDWAAPPNTPFSALGEEIKSQKDEIFRIAHQMALGVENNAAAVGRSADSKTQDAQSTRVILTAYGRVVKEVIELVYDMISAARGDGLKWSVGGLDDFASVDATGFLTMSAEIEKVGGIPSKSFNADLKYKLASSILPDADEARKQLYKTEIEDNTQGASDAQRIQAISTADAANVNAGIFLPEEVALVRAQPGGYALEMNISDEARKAREEAVSGQLEKMVEGEPEPSPIPPGQLPPGGGFGAPPSVEPDEEDEEDTDEDED